MDGYAIRADDLAGPWRIIGESAAGHPFAGSLKHGEAIRISTGAHMPDAGGAVLLQEHAHREGDTLSVTDSHSASPQYVRKQGFDFRKGDALLKSGTRIGPAQIAVALAGGHSTINAGKLPQITIIECGDELAADPLESADHQIPATNGPMLAAMAAPYASQCKVIGPIADDKAQLIAAFDQTEADVIVTCGGASVGDHDLVRPALEDWGATLDFWRVAMKPGKPLMVARKGKTIILGLPGNPVSSFVTGYLFLLPLLRRLAGPSASLPTTVMAKLTAKLPPVGDRREFVRAHLAGGEITPVNENDSSALRALAAANALIERPEGSGPQEVGTPVKAYLLENGGIA